MSRIIGYALTALFTLAVSEFLFDHISRVLLALISVLLCIWSTYQMIREILAFFLLQSRLRRIRERSGIPVVKSVSEMPTQKRRHLT
jgi:hypothetical protein